MVSVHDLSKTYNAGVTRAVTSISLDISRGELFGLIGPDGAGKTTLFRVLTTLLVPDSGFARVDGLDTVKDYREIRNRVGYMPGRFSLYQDLSVEENLNFFATLFGTTVAENYDLIREIYVQIEPFKKRRAGKLSGGMKQKLALCCALVHKPTVLFLDEPTTGVDPVSRKEFWEMLKRLKAQDITIMVSTPYMDEASLCDRIALIQSGTILALDTPDGIIRQYPEKLYAVRGEEIPRLLQELRGYENTLSCHSFGEHLHVSLRNDSREAIAQMNEFLLAKGHKTVAISPVTPTIEDCFIRLLQRGDGNSN
jgi:ABC-type multidrug transport system ATPase subunit